MTKKDSQAKKSLLIAFIILLLAVCAAGVYVHAGESKDVFISEVCPHNFSVMYDQVGYYHDFIELTNSTGKTINLAGYGLSDDGKDLKKFEFADITLPAGGSITVWADVDRAYYDAVGVAFEDKDGLYTQFKLKDHEMIYLTAPDGRVIDSVRLPNLKKDMSYIRSGPADKGHASISKYYEGVIPERASYIDPPVLSAASGYYDDPFDLTMESDGYEILYTTDGSDPAINGITYDGPVRVSDPSSHANVYANIPASNIKEQPDVAPVNKAFIIRAVAKTADGLYSDENHATYFIGSNTRDIVSETYTLSIISDPEGLFSDRTGICVPGKIWDMNRAQSEAEGTDARFAPANFNARGKEWRRSAHLTLFDKDMNCLYDEDDTINVRGATARFLPQKSFAIKPAKDGQRVFDGLVPGSGDSFDLRTGGEDEAFLTNFRDSLNSTIAKDMDILTQRSVCCQVYLDGEYWGCYNLVDHINTSLIAARYDIRPNNINLIKNNEVVSGRAADHEQHVELEEFTKNNDFADDGNYARFCEMVDIDNLIDFYIAEIFFANHDAYINNIGIWRSREAGLGEYEDNKWRFILFDTDDSDSIWEDTSDKDSFAEGNWMGINPVTELYFSNLWKNAAFRERFSDRFKYLLDNDLSYEKTAPIIDSFEKEYGKPMVRSMIRYGKDDMTVDQYKKNVDTVRSFFSSRCENIEKYLMQHMED